MHICGTLKCENAAICEKVAKCEKNSTLNVKIDAICEKITLNVKKWGSLNVSNISTQNVLKWTLYVQTLCWRYLWKSNFNAFLISEKICLGLGYQSTQCICMWIWIYMYNAQFKTMFKLIAIDLMLLLVNFSYELVQQKFSDIASLGPGEWF